MGWSYRVAKVTTVYGDYYDMREWYDELPNGPAWSVEPEAPIADSIDRVIWQLRHMLRAAKKARRHPELMLLLNEDGNERKEGA